MTNPATGTRESKRIACIDQLRGYAIFGMLLVNARGLFFEPVKSHLEGSSIQGFFESCLYQISHHTTTFTYADTIAPLFVFVVGMGMRLSWLRRCEQLGVWETRKSLVKRYSMLVLIAFAIYAGWYWDALMDIGLAGLLAVMLIDKRPRTRVVAAFAFVAAFQCIHMFTSYGTWSVHGKFSLEDPKYVPLLVRLVPLNEALFGTSLNGGPLGPMSWVLLLLFGSHAYDLLAERNNKKFVLSCLGWGAGLCILAWVFSMEWPGVKAAWPFSARYMTVPFPLWAAGLCFFQVVAFYLICDRLNLAIPTFTSVGANPLTIYIVQSLFLDVAEDFAPEQLSLVVALVGFAVFWGIFAGAAYYMHRKRIYIKI